jgi:two-component system response regulator FixJ
MTIMTKLHIYVIDDDNEFRESTSWMLEGEGYSVESFADPVKALEMLVNKENHNNSCCLLDIRMATMTGLEFHDNLLSNNINLPVIYMTGHGDVSLAVEAMSKGAITFLEKPLDIHRLRAALNVVFRNCAYNDFEKSINHHADPEYLRRVELLTERERSVLREVISGKMNKEIAIKMGVSVKTVELHRSRVMSKMDAKTLVSLVKMCVTQSIQAQ